MKNWVCVVLLVTEVYSANVKRQFQGCIYEGRTYQQGETWQKSCELNCVCQDASSGRYQCNSICPTYSDLPPSCILVKAPGECCAKPQCNFQPAVQGSFAGTGTGSGSGSVPGGTSSGPGTYPVPQTGTPTGGSCSDKIQTCNAYGTSVCSDQSYAKWVENNCCAYCRRGTSSGPGTYPVPQTGTPTGGSCSDQIQTCNAYGTSVCSDQSYAKWVENNCCAYCRSNTGGNGTLTGETGPMTGGTGTMTGGTGTMTGGTGTMTGGGSGYCADKISNCNTYGKGVCSNPAYSQWVADNCALYCEKCGGTRMEPTTATFMGPGTGTTTGTGTLTGTGSCTDKISNCNSYGTGVCSNPAYSQWVTENCGLYCGKCTMAGPGTGYPVPQPGSSTVTGGSCTDKISNCNTYGKSVCSNPTYSHWVTENCGLYCGKCGGTMTGPINGPLTGIGNGTMPGTGTSSMGTGVMPGTGTSSVGTGVMPGTGTSSVGTGVMPGTGTGTMSGTGGCVDKTTNCAQLDLMQHICSDTGAHIYVQTNCPQTCNLCPNTSCADKITNCAAYGSSVCTDATYSNWVTENCAKSCNKCSGAMMSGNGPMTGGTGPMTGGNGAGTGGMTGHSSGCAYKTQVYQQGQSWNDGCNLKCTCSDGSSGQYTCTALCVSWQLPSACTLSPPAPGKCCTTPSCPAGYIIQYPQGYQDN